MDLKKILLLKYIAAQTLISSIACSTALAASINPERHYQRIWCDDQGGVMEYRLDDGSRIDCLTDSHAVEFDFARKWSQSVGQALYYGQRSGRQPAVVLIMEGPGDIRYLRRLLAIAPGNGLTIWTISPSAHPDSPPKPASSPGAWPDAPCDCRPAHSGP